MINNRIKCREPHLLWVAPTGAQEWQKHPLGSPVLEASAESKAFRRMPRMATDGHLFAKKKGGTNQTNIHYGCLEKVKSTIINLILEVAALRQKSPTGV